MPLYIYIYVCKPIYTYTHIVDSSTTCMYIEYVVHVLCMYLYIYLHTYTQLYIYTQMCRYVYTYREREIYT